MDRLAGLASTWERRGGKGKLRDTLMEVEGTQRTFRKSQGGLNSIDQRSKTSSSRGRGNELASANHQKKVPCIPSASEVRETHTDPPKSCLLERRNQPKGQRTGALRVLFKSSNCPGKEP